MRLQLADRSLVVEAMLFCKGKALLESATELCKQALVNTAPGDFLQTSRGQASSNGS
jgi:hypothetical protein